MSTVVYLSNCIIRVQSQVYRKCLINSLEINGERNEVGEEEFFLFQGLIQYLILLEI